MENKPEKTFWITNFSNRNVTLSDLYISVPAKSSINLLDKKHYHFTEEQVVKSAAEGSLFKKRDKISIRKVPPLFTKKNQISIHQGAVIPSRSASIYEIKQENYEELNISDDENLDDKFLSQDKVLSQGASPNPQGTK